MADTVPCARLRGLMYNLVLVHAADEEFVAGFNSFWDDFEKLRTARNKVVHSYWNFMDRGAPVRSKVRRKVVPRKTHPLPDHLEDEHLPVSQLDEIADGLIALRSRIGHLMMGVA